MINATGNLTALGGSTPSAAVRKAMQEADGSYVEMAELLEKTGQYIATQRWNRRAALWLLIAR